jgi:hypothetical protein
MGTNAQHVRESGHGEYFIAVLILTVEWRVPDAVHPPIRSSSPQILYESQQQIQSDCELGHGEYIITVLILLQPRFQLQPTRP